MVKRLGVLLTVVAAVLLACSEVVLAQSTELDSSSQKTTSDGTQNVQAYEKAKSLQLGSPGSGQPGPLSAAQKRTMAQGYLVPDQAAYERAKGEANAKAEHQPSGESTSGESTSDQNAASSGIQTPQSFRSWEGANDPNFGPSDSTGAIGTGRYIELVNSQFAIYDRTSDIPLFTGSLNDLVGEPLSDVFDPQIIWDPNTSRFFYAADDVVSSTDNRIAFGFSTTATPSSAADFCKYVLSYGSDFPDFPKLGDTQNFIMIGVNTFDSNDNFIGSDLNWISKPSAGTTCPNASTFTSGQFTNLQSNGGAQTFTPVPANQIDGSGTGYIVAIAGSLPASKLSIYTATENSGSLSLSVSDLTVPKYSIPANAKQPGRNSKRLDTSDARNTQAVSAIDPSQGKVALWTQHTIFGGAGARVRWYEIDPSAPALFQSGNVSSSKRFIFNGAISPDRIVNGTTTAFGDSMVLNFNSSNKKHRPDIRMLSKIGSNDASSQVVIQTSPSSLNDFTCMPSPCRWGDYAAATPDPSASSSAPHGQVWLTSQWVKSRGSSFSSGWGSWNWATQP